MWCVCVVALLNARLRLIGLLCSSIGREDVWRGDADAEERITRGGSACPVAQRNHRNVPETKEDRPGIGSSRLPFSPLLQHAYDYSQKRTAMEDEDYFYGAY